MRISCVVVEIWGGLQWQHQLEANVMMKDCARVGTRTHVRSSLYPVFGHVPPSYRREIYKIGDWDSRSGCGRSFGAGLLPFHIKFHLSKWFREREEVKTEGLKLLASGWYFVCHTCLPDAVAAYGFTHLTRPLCTLTNAHVDTCTCTSTSTCTCTLRFSAAFTHNYILWQLVSLKRRPFLHN